MKMFELFDGDAFGKEGPSKGVVNEGNLGENSFEVATHTRKRVERAAARDQAVAVWNRFKEFETTDEDDDKETAAGANDKTNEMTKQKTKTARTGSDKPGKQSRGTGHMLYCHE